MPGSHVSWSITLSTWKAQLCGLRSAPEPPPEQFKQHLRLQRKTTPFRVNLKVHKLWHFPGFPKHLTQKDASPGSASSGPTKLKPFVLKILHIGAGAEGTSI